MTGAEGDLVSAGREGRVGVIPRTSSRRRIAASSLLAVSVLRGLTDGNNGSE